MRDRLAALAGVPPQELIITRNTTESLDTVIGGFPWEAGDEAVMAAQDYGAMLDMFRLQARRHGLPGRVFIQSSSRSTPQPGLSGIGR